MNRKKIIGLIATGAAGLAAAAALTLPATASAYTPDQLPGLGYHVTETNLGNNCHDWAASGYGASADLGSDCDPGFQATLDSFIDSTYPKPPTTTATTTAAATTTDATPTTTATTTTEPAVTATAPATTTEATTAPVSAPPATTDTQAAPATDTTQTAPAPTCDVQCQIADLQGQINSLRNELTSLVKILEAWPNLDPGILAQLMAVGA